MKIRFAILFIVTALLSGCASVPQQSVSLTNEVISPKSGRIGVVMTALPKLETRLPGADCLLCIAAASLMNSSLISHTKTLSYEDLPSLKVEVADALKGVGADVVVIDDELNIASLKSFAKKGVNVAERDFTPLQEKYNVDRLLVINITALGFVRTYSAYVPTSDPKGQLQGLGYMINLRSNTYDWYQPVSIVKSAAQNWDEPPKFPSLTNAYFQALELGKESFIHPFTNGQFGTQGQQAPEKVSSLAGDALRESKNK